jgi:hypothetical protein
MFPLFRTFRRFSTNIKEYVHHSNKPDIQTIIGACGFIFIYNTLAYVTMVTTINNKIDDSIIRVTNSIETHGFRTSAAIYHHSQVTNKSEANRQSTTDVVGE